MPNRALLMFLALWVSVSFSTSAQEFRAAWADVFHVGMGSQTEVDNMVNTLVSGHYNVVIVQVLGYMDNSVASHGAHWKSSVVPWSSRVTASFDPLAYLCQKAHANNIEVHAWLGGSGGGPYRVSNSWPPAGNTTLASHPEWFMVPRTNSEAGAVVPFTYTSGTTTFNYCLLDMGSSDAQEYLVSIVRELVTNYPVDGINWDDEIDTAQYTPIGMGFPAYSQAAYPRSGLARYRNNTGYVGTPAATDSAYNDYRRRFKNELMARMQAEIQSIKTNPRQPVRHTTAALAYSPSPTSCDFTVTTPYAYYCDWAAMLQNGWVDAVVPQTYSSGTAFNNWVTQSALCWQGNRNVFPGIGAYLVSNGTTASEITYTRSKGLIGNSIYSYAVPNNGGTNGSWWAYAAANVYTNVVSTPSMPWRNPATATEGILWGRVKDGTSGQYVDDAIVTVAGRPLVRTDGNGYFIATMVPAVAAGTSYSVTANKSGLGSQTTNATVLAGDIVRYDFVINIGAPSAPSGLAANAASYSQVNLTWTDNSTNETAFIIARSSVSGGPYTDLAAVAANTTSYSNTGLTPNTSYFYVVRATNSLGTSLNSSEASATTLPNPAPQITAQPQSRTVVLGSNATFTVAATGATPLYYQWKFNGNSIGGAVATSYSIAAAQYQDGGSYSVIVSNAYGTAPSASATLTVLSGTPTLQVSNIWNIQAGSRTYVTTGSTERGICLNPSTGHVLLVSRSSQLAGSLGAFILDADTGAQTGVMDLTGVNNTATFVLNKIDTADDGVIYGGNLTTASSTSPFVIYRWANEGATAAVAYSGAPDGGTTARWGDTFSVYGAGVNTRILISGSGATNTVLFTTTDGTNFIASKINPSPNVSAAEFSRGLYLVGDNSFYVKNRATNATRLYAYNSPSNSASVTTNLSAFDNNMIAVAVATNYRLLAGVLDDNTTSTNGHSLKIYDVSSPNSAVLVSNFNFLPFGSNTNSGNANFGAAVDTDGVHIVALDTQNGVVAVRIVASNPSPHINGMTLLAANRRRFELNADPGNFVMQASSDFSNWVDLSVTRTNGLFEVTDPATNALRVYRTKK